MVAEEQPFGPRPHSAGDAPGISTIAMALQAVRRRVKGAKFFPCAMLGFV